MEDDCDETENSKSIKLKISKISLKRSMSEEWSLNETKKMRRDSSDEISSRASSSGFSSIHENNERKRFRSEKTIKDGCEYQSDQTFVNQGNMYNSMASEMHDMNMDNYLDIKIYCKDGSLNANSFLTGLAFFELRGIGELVGRDLIIPDIRVKELKKKLKNVLVSIGLLKCKEPEELIKTPELVTTSPELVTTSPELLTTSPELVTLSAECNSEYVPVEDEKTGGLAGFLPTDEASPKNTRVFISSKDGVIERKEKEQVLEIETPTKETPTKKTSEVKAHLRPTCKKCHKRRGGLMDFFHHSPCNDVKQNTCIICKTTVEGKTFKGHLKVNKKCMSKLKQMFYKERNIGHTVLKSQPLSSKVKVFIVKPIKKKGIISSVTCKECGFAFKGSKTLFLHHKCWSDSTRCKFCSKEFEEGLKIFSHFEQNHDCMTALKKVDLSKIINHLTKKDKLKPKRKFSYAEYYCKLCNEKFLGKAGYVHHKCICADPTKCKFCQKPFNAKKKSQHFSSKHCKKMLDEEKVDKESTIIPVPLSTPQKSKAQSKVTIYNCKICNKEFRGKAAFIHHECLCANPNQCKYCERPFTGNKKSRHFCDFRKCGKKLQEEKVEKDSVRSLTTVVSKNVLKALICKACNLSYKGRPAFVHHKCFCEDPTKCKFCGQMFKSSRKSLHFKSSKRCTESLVKEIAKLKSHISHQILDTSVSYCKIPKSKPIHCNNCNDTFYGYVSYYQHKCKHNGPETKCRLCNQNFESCLKFNKHLHYRPQCRGEIIELIKRDFPGVIEESTDSKEAVAAIPNDEDELTMTNEGVDETKSLNSPMPYNCKFPKPKGLICNLCEKKFNGYIVFYQHECKNSGPRNKCRFCGQDFENCNRLSIHLSRGHDECKVGYQELIKQDFPDAFGEASDAIVNVSVTSAVENDQETPKEQNLFGKFPKPDGLICTECQTPFSRFIPYYKHECKFNEHKGKCWFCEESFEDEKKFGKHLYTALKCRNELIKRIERDFPKAFDKEKDDTNNVTAIPNIENEPAAHIKDNVQTNEKFPKPKCLICNDCGIKFIGYVTYYQHQCKLNGPQGKCRFCEHVYEDHKKFAKHLTYRLTCRSNFIEMIKRDFPDAVNEIVEPQVDPAVLAKVQEEHAKYAIKAKLNSFTLALPKKDKSIPQDLIDESKAFLEKLIDAEHVSNNKRATFKQKSKQKIKIEAEEYYELRIPSPLPGTQHIIEMDNGEEDLEPEENDRYSYQHFGIENGVGEVGMDDVRSIEHEGNVCEDIDDSLLEEEAAEESMEELGTIAGEERNNTEDNVQEEVTEEGIFDDELVDGEERMDADGIIGGEKSIYTENGRIAREKNLNIEDMVEEEAIEESMNEGRIIAGKGSLNAEDLFEEEAAEVDEDGKVDEEVSIDTEDIIEEKAAEGSMAEGGKDEIINSEEDKGTDKVVSKWEEFLKELEENNRQIILKDNDVALDKEKKSSSDETTELLKEGKELEDGDDCMKSGVVEIKNGYVDIENETEESFEEEDIEIADAEVDELEDGEMVTVEYQDCCISSTNDREKLREFLAENQITAHNISFKDMDYTKSKHTAFFKVSQEDMRKIQKENIRPEKDCIIHILNISTDLQR